MSVFGVVTPETPDKHVFRNRVLASAAWGPYVATVAMIGVWLTSPSVAWSFFEKNLATSWGAMAIGLAVLMFMVTGREDIGDDYFEPHAD